MADVVLALAAAAVKAACKIWLKDEVFAQSMSVSTVDLLEGRLKTDRERRKARRTIEDMEESLADTILQQAGRELDQLPQNEREAAVLAVRDTLDEASLTDKQSFEIEPYAREVLSAAPGVRSIELSDPALVPLVAHIPSVRAITWSFQHGHGVPEDMGRLEQIQTLNVTRDPEMSDVGFVSEASPLSNLVLRGVPQVDMHPVLAAPLLDTLEYDVEEQGRVNARTSRISTLRLRRLQGRSSMPALPPTLRSLQLTHPRGLDDLGWLSRVENTEMLSEFLLTGNPKIDLAGIERWAGNLIDLSLVRANAFQLGRLAELSSLRTLTLLGQYVKSLEFAAGLRELRSLTYDDTYGDDLSLAHCADLPHLESVLIGGSGVVDLTPFAGRSGLRIADLGRHSFVGAELLGPGSEILTGSGVITSSKN